MKCLLKAERRQNLGDTKSRRKVSPLPADYDYGVLQYSFLDSKGLSSISQCSSGLPSRLIVQSRVNCSVTSCRVFLVTVKRNQRLQHQRHVKERAAFRNTTRRLAGVP